MAGTDRYMPPLLRPDNSGGYKTGLTTGIGSALAGKECRPPLVNSYHVSHGINVSVEGIYLSSTTASSFCSSVYFIEFVDQLCQSCVRRNFPLSSVGQN
mgnify:CR=1 FL=1